MSLVYVLKLWASYALFCLSGNLFCLHYTSAIPISNSQGSEKFFADTFQFQLVFQCSKRPPSSNLRFPPSSNLQASKIPILHLGATPLRGPGLLDLFPINASVPYAIARYLVADLLVTNPSFTAAYEGSDIEKFNLHSLNYFCSTVNIGLVPNSVLIDCTLKFVSYYPSKNGDGEMVKGGEMEVRFVPLPGGETPIIMARKSPMAFVDFGGEFDGAETVEIEYVKGETIGLFGRIEIPEALARTGVLNKQPTALLAASGFLKTEYGINGFEVQGSLNRLKKLYPRLGAAYPTRPSPQSDDSSAQPSKDDDIQIHYGLIVSSNQVIKDAEFRDSLTAYESIIDIIQSFIISGPRMGARPEIDYDLDDFPAVGCDDLPEVDIMIAACAGLLKVDQDTGVFESTNSTAKDFQVWVRDKAKE
ncbi:hypothetical protein TWF173_009066 [Orbilia oligospora]|nr:hypothetical protein TWF173_009066 [Orbilia oligospora]